PAAATPTAGQAPGGKHPAAQYNLFDIDGEKGNWRIRLTRRGLTGPSIPPSDLQTVELGAEAAMAAN
ncbi:metallophosphoesterase, partial [Mesorhizobium sp. M7A.F.Ca.CA.002.09.1.1]